MPVVDIKGVGKAQFPDEMPINDIKTFLRNKYFQDIQQGRSRALDPQPQTAANVNPSLIETAGQKVSDYLFDKGIISDRYGAQEAGKGIVGISEFLEVIGSATAGDDFGKAAAQGDILGMGVGLLGAVPVLGDVAKKGATLYRGQPKNKNLKINDEGLLWVTPDKDYANDPHYGGKDGAEVLKLETAKDLNLYDPSKDIDYLIAKGKEKGINRPLVVSAAKGDFRALKDPEIQSILRESGYDGFKAIEPEGQPSVALFDTESIKPSTNNTNNSVDDLMADLPKFSDKVAARRNARLDVFGLPTKGKPENIKYLTDLTDYTPEQLVSQLKVLDQSNIKQGGYLKKGDGLDIFYKNDGTSQMIDPKTNEVIFEQSREQTENLAKNDILEISESRLSPEQRKIEFDARKKSNAEARAREEAQQETYKMQHTAPMREDNSTGYDLTSSFGDDIYTNNAVRYFGGGTKDSLSMDTKAVNIIQGMKGKPEKEITIYRAVPKDVKSINSSDWVTTTKEYAQSHMEGEKNWHILSKKVKAKDIATDGNSIHEFGYDPQ